MSWWFPTFTPDGRIVSGDGEVWLDGQVVGPGYSPVSVDAARVIVAEPSGLLTLAGGALERLPFAFSGRVGNVPGVSGGAGHWAGWAPQLGLVADGASVDGLAAPGSIDRKTGRLAYLRPYQSDVRDVLVGATIIRRGAVASEIRAADGAVVWSEWEGGVRKLWGFRGIEAARLSVMDPGEFEFTAVPVLVAGDLWLVVGTHVGLVVYPWGDPLGYVLEGEWMFHDAAFFGERLRIAATSGSGSLQYVALDLTAPRVDLRDYHPTTGADGGGGNGGEIEEPMRPPIVTVDRWTLDELLDGREFVFGDSANPNAGYTIRVHVAGGSMYAEITNAAGKASTGLARPVKPCEDHGNGGGGGNGGHEPGPPSTTTIATVHGTFWTVERDGRIVGSDRADPFTLEPLASGRYAIKAANGFYVAAELSASPPYYLIANRSDAGGWESFRMGPSGDDDRPRGVSWQADNDRYVAAEADGRITVDRADVGPFETFEIDRPALTLPRLVIRDQYYFGQATGARWHAAECSDFSLYKYFLDGRAIDPVLEQRARIGFTLLRVWLLNTSVIPGGLEPRHYGPAFYQRLPAFLSLCESYGLYVELTAFTQTQTLMPSDDQQLEHWALVGDAVRNSPNVIVELCNEIDQHDNAPSATFARLEGVICSSGSNGADHAPPVPPLWDYVTHHTNDLPEWQRKVSHNGMADAAEPNGVPCISNENTRFPDRDQSLAHAYDAGAGSALLVAGACFHSVHGKTSELFEGVEYDAAVEWIAGVRSTPLEYQPGQYARHDDLVGPDCIRAYSRTLPDGRSWLVKIRP